MKNKDFNLIEYLASKNIFVNQKDISNKSITLSKAVNTSPEKAKIFFDNGSSRQNTLKNSFNTLKNKSRNETLHHRLGARILFVDFKNKTINKKRGLKNV